jgi:hypothetical protein
MNTKKYLPLILSAQLLSSMAFSAQVKEFEVMVRDENLTIVSKKVVPSDLGYDEDTSDFKKFQIYRSNEGSPLVLNELEKTDQLKVATMAYHLNRAVNYFQSNLEAEQFDKIGKFNVRLEMARHFNTGKHFNSSDTEYNNAVTLKPSNENKLNDVKPWGYEVWFRPAKDIKDKAPRGALLAGMPAINIVDDVGNTASNIIISSINDYATNGEISSSNYTHYGSQLALVLAMKTLLPTVLDFGNSLISYETKLDAGMIPEVIYHEITHVAMSDFIPVNGNYGISEGMANYFAAVILGKGVIASKLSSYGKNIMAIKPDKKQKYRSQLDYIASNAHRPFTFSFLWTMRERFQASGKQILGVEDGGILFDKIVFESRKHLDVTAEEAIIKELCVALLKSSSVIIADPTKARLARMMIQKGAVDFGL